MYNTQLLYIYCYTFFVLLQEREEYITHNCIRPAYWAPASDRARTPSSREGEQSSVLGPGEPYTLNSEEHTNCLGSVEPYAPPMHISELIVPT